MKLIALDTSTDTVSLAVQNDAQVFTYSGPGGAQASTTLIPALRQLMQEAQVTFETLDAIVFGRGPGSFTGLRTACAVAQGLAFGARHGQGVPVLPIDTLLAVAEEARQQHGCTQVVTALDARMDEVYTARCAWQGAEPGRPAGWRTDPDFGLGAPETVQVPEGWTLAGNARAVYGERLAPGAPHVSALPTAQALLRLAPALLAAGGAIAAPQALPRYIRDKVAQTTAEREALRAASPASTDRAPR